MFLLLQYKEYSFLVKFGSSSSCIPFSQQISCETLGFPWNLVPWFPGIIPPWVGTVNIKGRGALKVWGPLIEPALKDYVHLAPLPTQLLFNNFPVLTTDDVMDYSIQEEYKLSPAMTADDGEGFPGDGMADLIHEDAEGVLIIVQDIKY